MSDLLKRMLEVTAILKNAKCELIDRKRCFVLEWGDFLRISDFVRETEGDFLPDERLAAQGYNNLQLSLSASDRGRYFVACKTGPMLDEVWKEPAAAKNVDSGQE